MSRLIYSIVLSFARLFIFIFIDLFHETISVDKDDFIIEPSAGNGSFSQFLQEYTNLKAYDLFPEKEGIIQQDFFTLDIDPLKEEECHVLGNPPFGRQSSLAKRFIKKCCFRCSTYACFI